jgi:ADP-ribosyl-[dinitrogen reductase] hydrolase
LIPAAHIRLALLAGAAGDCIGGPREGLAAGPELPAGPRRVSDDTARESIGGPREGLAAAAELPAGPWRISDDTALTMATCRAIIAAGGVDPAAIAGTFAREYRGGTYRGLGSSTTKALRDLAQGVHWALSGRTGEYAAGNGAAMRIAPLAFIISAGTADERRLLRDVSRITHRNDEAYTAALAVVRAMHLVSAAPAASLLSRLAAELPDTRVRDAILALAALPPDASLEAAARTSGTSAHAPESVPLAIHLAARSSLSAPDAILAAVRCGGDTDTIASIAGQVCGAAGSSLPEDWLERLPVRDEIEHLAAQLVELSASR